MAGLLECWLRLTGIVRQQPSLLKRTRGNRLIGMEEKVIPGTGIRPARQRLEFGYDGQSRRVLKRVRAKTNEASEWSLRQER